jgi:urease accessory protein
MRLIHGPILSLPEGHLEISLHVDRIRLAKRRWRGFAEDGSEFGFDLESPLKNGSFFFRTETFFYGIAQQPEPVIDIICPEQPAEAARLGWMLGNLHFPVEILPGNLRICDDPAVRQLLIRENFNFIVSNAIFQPVSGAHSHAV